MNQTHHFRLSRLWRLWLLLLGGAICLIAIRLTGNQSVTGSAKDRVEQLLLKASGLTLTDLANLPSAPGLRSAFTSYSIFFLARNGSDPRDLYTAQIRTTPNGMPIELFGIHNLTRTKQADESLLAASLPYIAVASDALLFVFDQTGEPIQPQSRIERLTRSITNFQDTGQGRGFDRKVLELKPGEKPFALEFTDKTHLLLSTSKRKLIIDCQAGTATSSKKALHPSIIKLRDLSLDQGQKRFISWAVDTVRNLSFVGPDRIAWFENRFYSLVDVFHRLELRLGYDPGAKEIVDEMAHLEAIQTDTRFQVPGWPPTDLDPPGKRYMLPGEGHWVLLNGPFITKNHGWPSPFAQTFLRPDPGKTQARVYLLAWDPRSSVLI